MNRTLGCPAFENWDGGLKIFHMYMVMNILSPSSWLSDVRTYIHTGYSKIDCSSPGHLCMLYAVFYSAVSLDNVSYITVLCKLEIHSTVGD